MYKVNTIISRFHTESSDIDQSIGSAVSVYGMSHGRNLLKKDAEDAKAGVDFYTNGYNNPYCRVWTHHHQYDDISKLIRPFTDEMVHQLLLVIYKKIGHLSGVKLAQNV